MWLRFNRPVTSVRLSGLVVRRLPLEQEMLGSDPESSGPVIAGT